MKVTVRLTVLKDKPYVKTPHFTTRNAHAGTEEFYCTTGVDSGTPLHRVPRTYRCRNNPHMIDIREATRAAVRNMIAFLGAEHDLSSVDAYMLCSVAGDLRMHEVVSAGVATVHVTGVDDLTAFSARLTCQIMWYVICKRSFCLDGGLTFMLSPDRYDVP